MEESEKRRERLSAMRALHQEPPSGLEGGGASGPTGLCNPLLDTPPEASASGSTPRFDFYTDPMAAFSGNRTRSASPSYPRPGPVNRCDASPPAAGQMRSGYPPDRSVNRAQGPYQVPYRTPAPRYWAPRDMAGPPPIYRDPPPPPPPGVGSGFGGVHAHPRHQGYPMFRPAAGSSLDHWRGRGQSFGNNPGYDSGFGGRHGAGGGRSRGRWDGGDRGPVMGRSGGRGRGLASRGSQLRPEDFYNASMVEDPWQHMEPVVWKGLDRPTNDSGGSGSSTSWLPKSISTKKPRVSEATFKSSPGQSLAEYLAASFKEAADDEKDEEGQ